MIAGTAHVAQLFFPGKNVTQNKSEITVGIIAITEVHLDFSF